MSNHKNPFTNIVIDKDHPHAEIEFTCDGVLAKATFNATSAVGRLSRGTVALMDPGTKRLLQKDPQSKTHKFSDAICKQFIVPLPKASQKQEDVILAIATKKVHELICENSSRLKILRMSVKDLGSLTIQQVLDDYLPDYLADRTTSDRLRATYRNQLQNLANYFSNVPIREITRKRIKQFLSYHQSENGVEYISELKNFLDKTAYRIGLEPPTEVLEKYLYDKSRTKAGQKAELQAQQKNAVNADVLPQNFEEILDRDLWNHLTDPKWAAAMTLKESGLPASKVCSLKIKDIEFDKLCMEKAFIFYRRDDLTTVTHDYTFPLSPCGGLYLRKYIEFLGRAHGANRLNDEKYLFAIDDNGEQAIAASDLNDFIRSVLSSATFGYAGRIELSDDLIISMSSKLLVKTREVHLREVCGLSNDPGALTFMLHLSMGKQVQSDHYRAFTDPTGRDYLWRRLRLDRHGLPESMHKAQYKRMSRVKGPDYDELRFPAPNDGRDMLITLRLATKGLNVGDAIEVIADEGCFLDVINN